MRLGALCWNQYATWPTCARPASGPTASASTRSGRGITSTRSSATTTDRSSRAGWSWRHGPRRPSARPSGSWSAPTRSATRRWWRSRSPPSTTSATGARSSASGPHGSRPSTTGWESSSAARPASACAGWTRPCRSCAACSTGRGPRADGRYPVTDALNEPRAGPGAPADPRRRRGDCARRCGSWRVRRTPATSAAASRACKHKDEILRRHCEEVGRDESEIERTVGIGTCIIRDDPAEAQRVVSRDVRGAWRCRAPWANQLVGHGRARSSRSCGPSAASASATSSSGSRRRSTPRRWSG